MNLQDEITNGHFVRNQRRGRGNRGNHLGGRAHDQPHDGDHFARPSRPTSGTAEEGDDAYIDAPLIPTLLEEASDLINSWSREHASYLSAASMAGTSSSSADAEPAGHGGDDRGATFMQSTLLDAVTGARGQGRHVMQFGSFYDYASHEIAPVEPLAGAYTRPLFGPTEALIVGYGVYVRVVQGVLDRCRGGSGGVSGVLCFIDGSG